MTTLMDCPSCRVRALVRDGAPRRCECGGTLAPADPAEVCDAPFPDASDTRCLARPHAPDEHDPEHHGVNEAAGWAPVVWRESEFQ